MSAFRHKVTGVLVQVSDETAGRLGSEWVKVEKSKPATRRRKSSDDESDD